MSLHMFYNVLPKQVINITVSTVNLYLCRYKIFNALLMDMKFISYVGKDSLLYFLKCKVETKNFKGKLSPILMKYFGHPKLFHFFKKII
jgi:hypothetical protein